MGYDLLERNNKLIDAIIQKANKVCPGSLAMIGVYGSFMTGDFYEKSDLDLLILINDDNGWQLGRTFIQDDLAVGHDLYCTKWEQLEQDACYHHPNISKLMDAKIVYCKDENDKKKLKELREKTKTILNEPFSIKDYEKAEKFFKDVEHCYTKAMITDNLSKVRLYSGYFIICMQNAIAMLNKTYFKRSVKRTYDELEQMKKKPKNLCSMIDAIVTADTIEQIRSHLTTLMSAMDNLFEKEKSNLHQEKEAPCAENIANTYEEMCSNWMNKMYHAITLDNKYLSFITLISLQSMLNDIQEEVTIGSYDAFEDYDSTNLEANAQAFVDTIESYKDEYTKIGLTVKHFSDIDAFIEGYLE